jgi:hypothetical protein
MVWASPRSLATTCGITIVFSSSGYLDVSVLRVSFLSDDISSIYQVVPFGNLRINSYVLIPAAYRSLSRPSSPLRAKAFAIRPYLLSRISYDYFIVLLFHNMSMNFCHNLVLSTMYQVQSKYQGIFSVGLNGSFITKGLNFISSVVKLYHYALNCFNILLIKTFRLYLYLYLFTILK